MKEEEAQEKDNEKGSNERKITSGDDIDGPEEDTG